MVNGEGYRTVKRESIEGCALFGWFCFEMIDQAGELAGNGVDIPVQGCSGFIVQKIEVAGYLDLRIKFAERSACYMQKLNELPGRCSCRAFGDIAWD